MVYSTYQHNIHIKQGYILLTLNSINAAITILVYIFYQNPLFFSDLLRPN